jgi:hypothetical protein
MLGESETLTRASPIPPLTRTLPILPSTRDFSSQISATSASWPRRAKERYKLEPPPSILFSMMRVILVIMKKIFLCFLKTLASNKLRKINELVTSINEKDGVLECQEDLLVKENEKFVKLKDALAHEKENSRI